VAQLSPKQKEKPTMAEEFERLKAIFEPLIAATDWHPRFRQLLLRDLGSVPLCLEAGDTEFVTQFHSYRLVPDMFENVSVADADRLLRNVAARGEFEELFSQLHHVEIQAAADNDDGDEQEGIQAAGDDDDDDDEYDDDDDEVQTEEEEEEEEEEDPIVAIKLVLTGDSNDPTVSTLGSPPRPTKCAT
jgi:hypothetical protein